MHLCIFSTKMKYFPRAHARKILLKFRLEFQLFWRVNFAECGEKKLLPYLINGGISSMEKKQSILNRRG